MHTHACIYFFPFSRDDTQSREEALSVLRCSGEFVRYALSVVVQKIQQLEETGHTDGPDGQSSDKTFCFLCDMTRLKSSIFAILPLFDHSWPLCLGRYWDRKQQQMSKCRHSVLMWRYTNIPSVVEEAGKKDKRSSLSQLCLEGLLRIFTTCQQRYPEKMAQLLSSMGWACAVKVAYFSYFYLEICGNSWYIFCCFHRHCRKWWRARWCNRDELLLYPTVSGGDSNTSFLSKIQNIIQYPYLLGTTKNDRCSVQQHLKTLSQNMHIKYNVLFLPKEGAVYTVKWRWGGLKQQRGSAAGQYFECALTSAESILQTGIIHIYTCTPSGNVKGITLN